jgi:SAM-dependent methyltransferase
MPDEATLASFYPEGYHSFALTSRLMRIRVDMRMNRLRKFLPNSGNVLDYGCGNGLFLRMSAQRFPDSRFYGYEIADSNEIVEDMDGQVTIYRGSQEWFWSQAPDFEVIILNHVIEHLPSPSSILSKMVEHLQPGGTIEGQTPRVDSYDARIFGHYWSGYHAPRHTVIFSKRSLELALENAGLSNVNVTAAFNPAGIAMSLGALAHGDNPGTVKREGTGFLLYMAAATGLSIIDFFSGKPGIVNFSAIKAG